MERIKSRVLLVDDVEANLIALVALLSDLPCELVRAKSGNEALKELLRAEFAVVLLDVQMPEMDGFEVARFARDNPQTRDVPIIFLTAMNGSEARMLRGYGSGAVDFLTKPINPYVLRSKVQVFIELYLSRQKLALEIAAHRRTLHALELSNNVLLHFTQAASHDLGAPLRSIRGFLGALSEAVGDQLDEKARHYLERSCSASERMDALLGSLRSYARLQKPALHAEVDCNAVLELIRMDLAEPLATCQATLEVGPLPTITGDRDRIYQLFLNLIGNALKYRRADEPPRVQVSAVARSTDWVFCVEDNGIGIDAAHKAAVFDAFSRLHEQAKYEGSGLGLAICRQIVEQHAGTIWLESELNRGSRFYFALPTNPPE